EGYMESAMSGILAAVSVFRTIKNEKQLILPNTTMCGALTNYISTDDKKDFQPMGANFGILPRDGINIKNKQERYQVIAERALEDLKQAIL
ncbi:MAG: methylenetetrahydrofolate--tRNA-(uracil(54)-C(5))-methyltransferase (FADH(2)-oxidizing) TrmFO, partial [Acutalibacteraceae bacterium]